MLFLLIQGIIVHKFHKISALRFEIIRKFQYHFWIFYILFYFVWLLFCIQLIIWKIYYSQLIYYNLLGFIQQKIIVRFLNYKMKRIPDQMSYKIINDFISSMLESFMYQVHSKLFMNSLELVSSPTMYIFLNYLV